MAFDIKNWSRQSVALNTGEVLVDGSPVGGPGLFTYRSNDDTAAQIAAANYFGVQAALYDLYVDDFIFAVGTDATTMLQVATIDRVAGTITTVSTGLTGSVGTANIDDLAVTTAKLAANAVTSAKIAVNVLQQAQVTMSAANWLGMYATPFQLVAAPGANLQHVVHDVKVFLDYNSTQFAAGGAIFVQYDTTANGAGTKATGTIAAAGVNSATVDSTFQLAGIQAVAAASTTVNKALCMTNDTAAFTTGNSTFKVDIWYSTVSYA